jgi:hypothetical protein
VIIFTVLLGLCIFGSLGLMLYDLISGHASWCRECRNRVSVSTKVCPGCGTKHPWRSQLTEGWFQLSTLAVVGWFVFKLYMHLHTSS